jgi:hypothetical protein
MVKGFIAALRSADSVWFAFGFVVVALGVASCGGEDSHDVHPTAAPVGAVPPVGAPPPVSAAPSVARADNKAPAISGTPFAAVAFGVTYSFLPTANDPDGGALTFHVANPPPWASFSTTTGRLIGTPGAGDVGTYRNITISVSDGTNAASLHPFTVDVVGTATGSITISWLAPVEETDGSPLTDLTGYKIYWGMSLGDYPNSVTLNHPGVVTHVIENLTPGTYYLVATAFDSDGVESEHSEVVMHRVL